MKRFVAGFLLGFTIWIPLLLFVYESLNDGGYFSIEGQFFWFHWNRAFEGTGISILGLPVFYVLYTMIVICIWYIVPIMVKKEG